MVKDKTIIYYITVCTRIFQKWSVTLNTVNYQRSRSVLLSVMSVKRLYVTSSVRVRWYGISSTLVADYLDINNDRKDKMCHDLLWRWILRIMISMELHFLGEKTYINNQVRNFRMICYDKKSWRDKLLVWMVFMTVDGLFMEIYIINL